MPATDTDKDATMSERHGLVRLDVGGTWYTTTASTLLAFKDSIFPKMLSKHQQPSKHPSSSNADKPASDGSAKKVGDDDKGHYFIDRDGELFRHVLNYMRTSQLRLPRDFKEFSQLKSEANFYGIKGLQDALAAHVAVNSGAYDIDGASGSHDSNNGDTTLIEVIETAHPEKIGVCCSRLVLTEALRSQAPFKEVLSNMPKHYLEEYRGNYGRFWVRTNVSRLDWAQRLISSGWRYMGSTSVCRRLPDVTGEGTDLCHIVEKWSLTQ